ncbi:hypothetical protein SOPP22_09870 [Shewanella sp. OPT22]|nr:hypothetical protein SOPP22_09870 [Shewanella sp. OPT22]
MRKSNLLMVGLLSMLFGLAACGGGSSKKGTKPEPDPVASPTCVGKAIPVGASCMTFQDGEAIVYEPDGENKGIALLLHGAPGHPSKVWDIFDGKALADKESLVTVAASGSGGTWGWTSLNDGRESSELDVKYLKEFIADLKARYSVTSERVYILGYSAGGFMGYKLACQIPEELTAIISLAGQFRGSFENCSTSTPVSIHHFHSPADSDVPMIGRAVGEIKSVEETLAHWRNINGCDEAFDDESVGGVTPTSSLTKTRTWKECVKSVRFSDMNNVPHEADYLGEALYDIYKSSL